MKFRFKPSWLFFERLLRVVEVVAVLGAALFVVQIPGQIQEWRNNQESRSFDFALQLEDKIGAGTNRKIFYAIEAGGPLLRRDGGKFTEEDLIGYLDDLASVADVTQRGLISIDTAYSWFSTTILEAYHSKILQSYISEIRKEDDAYYRQIDDLAKTFEVYSRPE